jgi:hypothetical protein
MERANFRFGRAGMPKKPQSTVFAERYAAWHVEAELEKRGWSYRELAQRMTQAGAPMNQSSIHKMLRQDPPRRITVNELAVLAVVFDVPMQKLVQSVDRSLSEEANRLLQDMYKAAKPYREATRKLSHAIRQLALVLLAGDEFNMKLVDAMARQEASMLELMDLAHEAQERIYAQAEADAEANRLPKFVRRFHAMEPESEDWSDGGKHRQEA